jgi:hypothetical protein
VLEKHKMHGMVVWCVQYPQPLCPGDIYRRTCASSICAIVCCLTACWAATCMMVADSLRGGCHLKAVPGQAVLGSGFFSGTVNGTKPPPHPPPPSPTPPCNYSMTNYDGPDIDLQMGVQGMGACCKLCWKSTRCTVWSYGAFNRSRLLYSGVHTGFSSVCSTNF